MSNWLDKIVPTVVRSKAVERKASVPDGLWSKCSACEAVLYQPELERNLSVCPKCGHHDRLGARARLNAFLDEGSQTELFQELIADSVQENHGKNSGNGNGKGNGNGLN